MSLQEVIRSNLEAFSHAVARSDTLSSVSNLVQHEKTDYWPIFNRYKHFDELTSACNADHDTLMVALAFYAKAIGDALLQYAQGVAFSCATFELDRWRRKSILRPGLLYACSHDVCIAECDLTASEGARRVRDTMDRLQLHGMRMSEGSFEDMVTVYVWAADAPPPIFHE